MSDEDAFIAGIRERPLDDLRRLVYADWLDERGRPDEAEYLRLVAALAETGATCHAIRLVKLAEKLEKPWRTTVGNRFDVIFDVQRNLNGWLYAFEEAVDYGEWIREMTEMIRYRVVVSDEWSIHRLTPQDVVLKWYAQYDAEVGRVHSSTSSTLAALQHIRRILAADHETIHLVATVSDDVDEELPRINVTLQADVPQLEAERHVQLWGKRLRLTEALVGATADPPFSGWIEVDAIWR